MPRGAPDYSNVTAGSPLHRVTDLAEVPARLGSPVTHDRAGNIVFMDSFEYGMASWQAGTSGAGAAVVVSPANKRSQAFSVKLTAGSSASRSAQISRAFPYPVLNKYGFESSVMLLTEPQYIIWTMGFRDGAQEHQYQCMYMSTEDQFVVTIPGGVSVAVIEDIVLSVGSGLFHTVKLVADLENGTYARLIVNEQTVKLTDKEPYTFAHVSSPHINVAVTVYSNTGENDVVFVDDVILTQNEP